MIRLQAVRTEDHDLLWNINQKYLYEMTAFYDDLMDENGNYHYGYFEDYFIDPRRKAFFIYDDGSLVGFVLISPYSYIGHQHDYSLAEFTIFPAYRRKHLAKESVNLILSTYPGRWEIKFNEKNIGAKKLWTGIAAPFNPSVYHLNDEETVLEFTVHDTVQHVK